jgi:hypothetical protein
MESGARPSIGYVDIVLAQCAPYSAYYSGCWLVIDQIGKYKLVFGNGKVRI